MRLLLSAVVLGFLSIGAASAERPTAQQGAPAVEYPEGYRTWAHVKSSFTGPTSPRFATSGGFQHIYANEQAIRGYRTRVFPEGSVIVFDWLESTEANGAFTEGARRQVDVMVRDSVRFRASGGWGFQRFVKDSRTEHAATPTPQQCHTCHANLARDGLVLSSYRP